MKNKINHLLIFAMLVLVIPGCGEKQSNPEIAKYPLAEVLTSWNGGEAKQSIISFVKAVTDSTSSTYVPEVDRIAVFDNDGTLWSEQPFYFQFQFAFDRVKEMAADHPEWNDNPLFKAALENDMNAVMKSGMATQRAAANPARSPARSRNKQ